MSEWAIEERLVAWGEALEFPDADRLADDVVGAIAAEQVGRRRWRVTLAAAAALLLVVAVIVAIPDSRHAVARWLGLERLEVRVVDEPSEPSATGLGPRFSLEGAAVTVGVTPYALPPLGEPVAVYAPGAHYVAVRYDDDGTMVLVATLPGRLFHKEVAMGAQAEPLVVRGVDGLWVSGAPHQLVYEEPGGDVVQSRMSADTLVWQEGDVIVRIEGDIGRDRALELAAAVVPADGS